MTHENILAEQKVTLTSLGIWVDICCLFRTELCIHVDSVRHCLYLYLSFSNIFVRQK